MVFRFRTMVVVTAMSDLIPGMAEAIDHRRLELGMTIGDFAEAADLTRQGLDPIRRGERRNYNDRTILGIARALRWQVDWYERIATGKKPRAIPNHLDDEDWNNLKSSLSQEDRAAVRAIIDSLRAKRPG